MKYACVYHILQNQTYTNLDFEGRELRRLTFTFQMYFSVYKTIHHYIPLSGGALAFRIHACCHRQTPDSDLLKGALSNLPAIRAQINISCCVTRECAIAMSGCDLSNSTPGSLSETQRVAEASSALEECSSLKHKDLGSIPRTHGEKLGMMVHICRSSTGEVEAGEGPWGHTSSQSTLPGSCGLKTEAQGCLSSGLHMHAYMCGRAHTQHEKGFRSNWRRQSEHSATRSEFTYFQRCVLI